MVNFFNRIEQAVDGSFIAAFMLAFLAGANGYSGNIGTALALNFSNYFGIVRGNGLAPFCGYMLGNLCGHCYQATAEHSSVALRRSI